MDPKFNLICCIFLLFIVSCGDQEKIENLESNREVGALSSEGKIAEAHKVGPNLYGIFNSKAATREGFNYSDEFIASTIEWDFSTLDLWLEKPYLLVPGNRMVFSGMNKEKDRLDLIAYLHQETSK